MQCALGGHASYRDYRTPPYFAETSFCWEPWVGRDISHAVKSLLDQGADK
jgi:hypothetical protein